MFREIFLLSVHGEKIFHQSYAHANIGVNSVDVFISTVLDKCFNGAPFLKVGEYVVYFIKREDVFICGLVDPSQDSITVVTVLDRLFVVLRHFLTGFSAALCISSRPLLIEILTECLDGGFVMLLEPEKLQSFITQKQENEYGIQQDNKPYQNLSRVSNLGECLDGILENSVSSMPKIYIDIIEILNMEISSKEHIKTSKIYGTLNVNSSSPLRTSIVLNVSNVPDKLALHSTATQMNTDAIIINAVSSGKNRVLTYEINDPLRDPPILINVCAKPSGDYGSRSGKYDLVVTINSHIKEESEILNLNVDIPLPLSVTCVSQIEGDATILFDEGNKCATWRLKRIKNTVVESTLEVTGSGLKKEDFMHLLPMKVSFEVSNYVWSGFSVDSVSCPSQQSVANLEQFIRFATLVKDCIINWPENEV